MAGLFLELRKKRKKLELNKNQLMILSTSTHQAPRPAVKPMEEITVKQEFIEQCAKRRPPLKERYQAQFRDNMQLKMEIMKLRKWVRRLQRKVKKHKKNIAVPRPETVSLAIQTKDRTNDFNSYADINRSCI